jgi:hypothetical protein
MIFKKWFALFSDLGTGKTYMLLRDFLTMWQAGSVDGILVIAPVDVHRQWVEKELPQVTDQECVTSIWPELPPLTKTDLPRIFTIYPEAFRRRPTPPLREQHEALAAYKARRAIWKGRQRRVMYWMSRFLRSGRIGLIVDESQMMMDHKSQTAKAIRKLRDWAVYRRISSGYPAPGGKLEKYYSQYTFLSPSILKCKTYTNFTDQYCIKGGFKGKGIESYKNEDEFKDKIAPWTYTVELKDCMDMPERTWLEQEVDLTTQQFNKIKQIKTEFLVELEKKTLYMPMILQRLTRIQQASCGFIPYDANETAEGRPDIRLEWIPELRTLALENLLDRTKGKVIVWSRFSPCIERLTKHFGKIAVKYRGGMSRDERLDSKARFIKDPRVRVIFAQPKSAGTGTDGFQESCRQAFYWSNSYDSSQRRQTERRTWRLGQSRACVYTDLIAPGTYDARIRDVIMSGQRMSDNFHRELAKWKRNGG